MKNILTLTDFTKDSGETVQYALEYAKENDCTLNIFHKMEDDEWLYFDLSLQPSINFTKEEELTKNEFIQKWQKIAFDLGVDTKLIISSDPLEEAVQDIIKQNSIDLIIMGTTSEYKRASFQWFSNTQTVIKAVQCPVLVVKEKTPDVNFKRIVYASAFNLEDKESFQYFLDFLKPIPGAKLHLLCVNSVESFSQPSLIMKDVLQEFKEMATEYDVESSFFTNFTVDTGIRDFIFNHKPDLLVMSNKIKRPLKHMFKGNHTLWNAARIECPVLTIDYVDAKVKEKI